MSQWIQRSYPRRLYQASIKYAPLNMKECRKATLRNYSCGGLCFASELPLETQSEICIVMENYHPGDFGPEGYRSYRARIQWIQPLIQTDMHGYATGVQFLARSHDLLDTPDDDTRCVCDLCGVLTSSDKIDYACAEASLCPYCAMHLRSIPEGKIRYCLERFIMGNVV